MNLTLIEILGLVIGGSGIGVLISKLLNLKSEKRKNDAEAIKTEDEVGFVRDDKFKESYVFLEERLNTINQAYSDLQDQMMQQAKEYNERIAHLTDQIFNGKNEIADALLELKYYKGKCCDRMDCELRLHCAPFKDCCD